MKNQTDLREIFAEAILSSLESVGVEIPGSYERHLADHLINLLDITEGIPMHDAADKVVWVWELITNEKNLLRVFSLLGDEMPSAIFDLSTFLDGYNPETGQVEREDD